MNGRNGVHGPRCSRLSGLPCRVGAEEFWMGPSAAFTKVAEVAAISCAPSTVVEVPTRNGGGVGCQPWGSDDWDNCWGLVGSAKLNGRVALGTEVLPSRKGQRLGK